MKYGTYQKIINAVVVDEELTEKQMQRIFAFLKKNHDINDYEWYKIYDVYCVTCKKNLNDKPLSFIKARRLQLQHKRKRERYVGFTDSYCHGVELREVKKKGKIN